MTTMPEQKPGRSEQVVATPRVFAEAVEGRFGPIFLDAAATEDNSLGFLHFGPDSHWPDALAVKRWADGLVMANDLIWVNPPYAKIEPWAMKCVEQQALGCRIAMLVPAAVGSRWFNRYVRPFAYVLELTPRLTFVGHKSSYPKDLILAYYCPERLTGRDAWAWAWSTSVAAVPANDNGTVDPRQLLLPIIPGAATPNEAA